jgi:hypothetical protein
MDKLTENVTTTVKDAVTLHVETYLLAAMPDLESVEFHNVTDQIVCVRVKETLRGMPRHFEVRISEAWHSL